MICKAGDLTKDDIGAIRIADELSYVEIRKASVTGFLATIGADMKIEGTKDLVQLDKAPDLPAFERSKPNRSFKDKPRRSKADTSPVDWNNAAAPRSRKPKPEDRKPRAPKEHSRKVDPTNEGAHIPARRRGTPTISPKGGADGGFKGSGSKPQDRKDRSGAGKDGGFKPRSDTPKGPPPPKGKSNSKKNRARLAAAKVAKAGQVAPKRRKP
jgi:ATP-dependent RNA helicase DeaD